jgi:hypothetical protein
VEFGVEIYDAQAFPQKEMSLVRPEPKQMPFTPPKTGTYILRIRGLHRFGTYRVYMEQLRY